MTGIRQGLHKIKKDHRDYSFHRNFGTVATEDLTDFNLDAGLSDPIQNQPNGQFNLPALPYGCTDYTQSEICQDEDKQLYNPILLENVTHANANKGTQVRTSLAAAVTVYDRQSYYAIEQSHDDWFDSIHSAMQISQRPISMGTYWYPNWTYTIANAILVPPNKYDPLFATLHNWKICGAITIDGTRYLIGKAWIGGMRYFSREIINTLMTQQYTGAFTLAQKVPDVQSVQLTILQLLVSYLRMVISMYNGSV